MMDEDLLHFIWKLQKLKTLRIFTTEGLPMQIFDPGSHNKDSGPDFANARIKIDGIEWIGHVEIHIRSSDWFHHKHDSDGAYENVILHVVWQHDTEVKRKDGSLIPTLTLQDLVDVNLIGDYRKFMSQPEEVLCKAYLPKINSLIWTANLDAMLTTRLEQKSVRIFQILDQTNNDWEETAYRVMGRNFGFSTNAEVFQKLTESLPLSILNKTSDQKQVFALVYGQAGFLEECEDGYQQELKKEYEFLAAKYQLSRMLHRSHWKFGRMRPANFPTVRLAQFATIIRGYPRIFSFFREIDSLKNLAKTIQSLHLGEYWSGHYDFTRPLSSGNNTIGESTIQNLVINTAVPLLAAYAKHTDDQKLMDMALNWLEALPAERNRYTNKWTHAGRPAKSAFDSQAQITLFKDFCNRKKCLNCGIGSRIFSK